MAIEQALLSVSDKTGLVEFARRLDKIGIRILSTGGSAQALRDAGVPVVDVSEYTESPELFGGRVKTLHPKIHGGILHRRGNSGDVADARKHMVPAIDLVVVNLYPFEETIARDGVTLADAIEQIDVGGPTMIRAAAKNYDAVTVVVDPADYDVVANELEKSDERATERATRERLAIKAFQRTAAYDRAISTFLNEEQVTGKVFSMNLPLDTELRYGENPHQEAALYGNFSDYFTKLQGKEFSYTNILDIEAAAGLILEFTLPTVAILKHTNPCGVGSSKDSLREAWDKAFETDKQAPFGGVIICNRPLDIALARVICEIFTDIIIAPDFDADARALLQKKKKRIVQMREAYKDVRDDPVIRSAPGGLLVMDHDSQVRGLGKLEEKVKTRRPPSESELNAMRFGMKVVKHVKSNAVLFAAEDRTLAIGAGQMSRVDSCRIAVWKAQEAGLDLNGSVVASDAMFPFPDGLLAASDAGASAAIQPGGSMRDDEVIAAADERDMAMVFTGYRHFLH
jgi:phosphoribosylaminoimidazolecarboxamide formyltransferase/IMP cyclohydrolase